MINDLKKKIFKFHFIFVENFLLINITSKSISFKKKKLLIIKIKKENKKLH